MAHFARLNSNNVVTSVIVVNNEIIDSANEESSGIEFLQKWSNSNDLWKQTSFNAKINGFRKNYAGIGYTFDDVRDAFIPPKPYESWLLDEITCLWNPPVPYPEGEGLWDWNEQALCWVEKSN